MRRFLCILAALVFACLAPLAPFAVWEPDFDVPADEGYLLNLDTGQVLWAQNIEEPHAIASLTKLMTGLLLLESGEDLDTLITIPARLNEEFQQIKEWDGAYLDLQEGEEITLRNLLYSTLLPSTNDTASAIADYLTDGDIPAFVERMNQRAAQLGCQNTHFSCPHGLYDEDNYSTAKDLALIAQACLANPALVEITTSTSYWLPISNIHTTVRTAGAPPGTYLQLNSTVQLQLPESPFYREYARGLKTGFTDAAGRCLVTTAQVDGENYLLVLLGMPNQKDANGFQVYFQYATQLLDWAIERFEIGSLPELEVPLVSVPLTLCEEAEALPLYPAQSLNGLLLDTQSQPEYRFTLPESLEAPIRAGQAVGSAEIWQGDQLLGSVELCAGQDFARSSRLYWRQRLSSLQGWLLAAAAFLLVLLLAAALLALRVRQVRRRRARRRHYLHYP